VNRTASRPALAELLREHRDAVVQRWAADILATYPEEAADVFGRVRDRFANPVGHSVRTGAQGIVAALCDGMDPDQIRAGLREIIVVRAVQQFSASQAVGFVFRLKDAIRGELADAARDPGVAADLAALDAAIDRIALVAFDVFTECREQIYQLRVNEVRRCVAWVADRMSRRDAERAAG
jgi:hypothetical protein